MATPTDILHTNFGFDHFRDGQEQVINQVLNHQNTLAVMPTGGGKSLCYQIPALINPGVTIVVSPLLSLMKDQVDSLRQNGIAAAALNSATPREEVIRFCGAPTMGRLSYYMSPPSGWQWNTSSTS